jgi:hypothetical protein
MVTRDVLNIVIVIGGVTGMAAIFVVLFELSRRLRKKITASGENQA